jgi:hypothetical protein
MLAQSPSHSEHTHGTSDVPDGLIVTESIRRVL